MCSLPAAFTAGLYPPFPAPATRAATAASVRSCPDLSSFRTTTSKRSKYALDLNTCLTVLQTTTSIASGGYKTLEKKDRLDNMIIA